MLKKYILFFTAMVGIFLYANPSFAKGEDYGSYLVSSYALDKGDIGGAAKYFKAYTQKHPEDITNMRKAYMVMAMAGDIDKAAYYAAKDTAKDRLQVADFIMMIERAIQKDYGTARTHLSNFAKDNKALETLVSFSMAWLYVAEKEYDKAINTLEKGKSEIDLRGMYHLHSGMIYEVIGDKVKSIEHYEKALKNAHRLSPRGIKFAARALIKAGKKNLPEAVVKGYEKNNITTYLNDYRNYIMEDVPLYDAVSVQDGLSESFYGMASLFLQAGSNELAEMLYSNAMTLSPDFHSLKLMFGELYEQAKEYDRAASMYSQFDLDTPFGLTALSKKALMLGKISEDKEEAAKNTEKALKYLARKYPENITLALNYADYLKTQEEFEKSAVLYSDILKKVTVDDTIPNKYWLILFARATAYERAGKWDMAEKDFRKALELSPDNPHILNYLGYSWLSRGMNYEEAALMITKAAKKNPHDGHVIDSLGWAYYLNKEYKKAEETLERALDLLPGNSVVLDHLGDAYWKVGRKLEAEFQWKKAIELDIDLEKGDLEKIKYKLEHGLDDFEKNYKKG